MVIHLRLYVEVLYMYNVRTCKYYVFVACNKEMLLALILSQTSYNYTINEDYV